MSRNYLVFPQPLWVEELDIPRDGGLDLGTSSGSLPEVGWLAGSPCGTPRVKEDGGNEKDEEMCGG